MDMGALFAGLSTGLSAQFDGPYYAGQVLGETAPVMDAGGSIVTPGQPTARLCQVQIDSATDAMRQADGFADGDVRFIVLAASLGGALDSDARVRVLAGPRAGLWQVSAVSRDTFGALWEGRGRRA